MALRDQVRAIVDNDRFQHGIMLLILANAVVLGCETSPSLTDKFGEIFTVVDRVALGIFVLELIARIYAYRLKFFGEGWNWFDLLIISVSLIPAGNAMTVVRSLRVLRVLRLVSMVPSMRRVVTAFLRAIPGIAALAALLLLLLYVGGVMASNLFGASGDPRFGSLGATVLSLFQITTGDDWSGIVRDLMQQYPLAWIFFVVYLLVGTFTVLNLFIAVVCSAMQSAIDSGPPPAVPQQRSDEQDATLHSLTDEIRALRTEVAALLARSDDGIR